MLPVPLLPSTALATILMSTSLLSHDRIDSTGWSGNQPLRTFLSQLADTPRLVQLGLLYLRRRGIDLETGVFRLQSCRREWIDKALARIVDRLWVVDLIDSAAGVVDFVALVHASALGTACRSITLPSGARVEDYVSVGLVSEDPVTHAVSLPYLLLTVMASRAVHWRRVTTSESDSDQSPQTCTYRTLNWVKVNVFDNEATLERWKVFELLSAAVYCVRVNALIASTAAGSTVISGAGSGGGAVAARETVSPNVAEVTMQELLGDNCSASLAAVRVHVSTCSPLQLRNKLRAGIVRRFQSASDAEVELSGSTVMRSVFMNCDNGAGLDWLAFARRSSDGQMLGLCFQNRAWLASVGQSQAVEFMKRAVSVCPTTLHHDCTVQAIPVLLGTSSIQLPLSESLAHVPAASELAAAPAAGSGGGPASLAASAVVGTQRLTSTSKRYGTGASRTTRSTSAQPAATGGRMFKSPGSLTPRTQVAGAVIHSSDRWFHLFTRHAALATTFNINDGNLTLQQLESAILFDGPQAQSRLKLSRNRAEVARLLAHALQSRLDSEGSHDRLRNVSDLRCLLKVGVPNVTRPPSPPPQPSQQE